MATLDEIFQVEEAMEVEFLRLLSSITPNVYRSREKQDAASPWIEVMFLVGSVNPKHEHAIGGRQTAYVFDAWTGSQLEVKVVTQRQNNGTSHASLCGKVRQALQRYKLATNWSGDRDTDYAWEETTHLVVDIREAGTTHSVDEDLDLDISTMAFRVEHGVNANAWPDSN